MIDVSKFTKISRLHYITQDLPDKSHQELAEEACLAGVNWLQLRVKDKNFEEWLSIAKDVVNICNKYKVISIINDNPEIAKLSGANGVHLGKEDVAVVEARRILGENAIIGGTANSIDDIQNLLAQGINYIGLGPYRFTSTKKNLSPILGISGVKNILIAAKTNVPVVVIGSINPNDVDEILSAGAYGVAVSSAINFSKNKSELVKEFYNQLSINNII
jgi:thiamine-phosphate pyrophosphorylase